MKIAIAYFERLTHLLSRWSDRIAQGAIVAMMLLVAGNALLRFCGKPIVGTYDWTSLIETIVVAFALGYCAVQRGHVRVMFIVDLFPERIQAVIDSITGILSLGLFALAIWQIGVLGNYMYQNHEVSMTMETPFYPFAYSIAFGCALLWLVILIDTIKSLVKAVRG